MKISTLIVLLLSFSMTSFAQTVGFPPHVWISTWAMNNTPGNTQLPCSGADADHFSSQLAAYSQAYFPNKVDVRRILDRIDGQCLNAQLRLVDNGVPDLIAFWGHGNAECIQVWDGESGFLNFPFYGNTKWVIFNSCNTMDDLNDPNFYVRLNNICFAHGLHGMFGFRSKDYQSWTSVMCGFFVWCKSCQDLHMWDNFFATWIQSNQPMSSAWINAGYRLCQIAGLSLDIAAQGASVQLPSGQLIYGADESYENVYNGPMNGRIAETWIATMTMGSGPITY